MRRTLVLVSVALLLLVGAFGTSMIARQDRQDPDVLAALLVFGLVRTRDRLLRRRIGLVVMTTGGAFAAYVLLGRVPELLIGHPLVPWDVEMLFFLPIPFALGAAVLRYRLFDIRVIVRRSLVYGAITAAVTVVYLAAALGLGTLLGSPVSTGPLVAGAVAVVMTLALGARLRRKAHGAPGLSLAEGRLKLHLMDHRPRLLAAWRDAQRAAGLEDEAEDES